MLQPLREEVDPEAGIEPHCRRSHNKLWTWKAYRLITRNDLRLFSKMHEAEKGQETNLEVLVRQAPAATSTDRVEDIAMVDSKIADDDKNAPADDADAPPPDAPPGDADAPPAAGDADAPPADVPAAEAPLATDLSDSVSKTELPADADAHSYEPPPTIPVADTLLLAPQADVDSTSDTKPKPMEGISEETLTSDVVIKAESEPVTSLL